MDDGTRTLVRSCDHLNNYATAKIVAERDHINNRSQSSATRFGNPVSAKKIGVDDGTRTHDDRDHNPGLYQLSYAHHNFLNLNSSPVETGAPGRTRTCNPRLSLPTTAFTASEFEFVVWTISSPSQVLHV